MGTAALSESEEARGNRVTIAPLDEVGPPAVPAVYRNLLESTKCPGISPRLVNVGPVYGVRGYMQERQRLFELFSEAMLERVRSLGKSAARPMSPPAIIAHTKAFIELLKDVQAFDIQVASSRSITGPSTRISAYLPLPMTMLVGRPGANDNVHTEDLLIVNRFTVMVSRQRVDVILSPAHLALSRHALERIWERGRLSGRAFADALRVECSHILDRLSFAAALEIVHNGEPDSRSAVTLAIPFDDGLLIADERVLMDSENESVLGHWLVADRGRFDDRVPPTNSHHVTAYGGCAFKRIYTGTTYLSRRAISSQAKLDFLDLFQGICDRFDLRAVRDAYLAPCLETDDPALSIEMPEDLAEAVFDLRDRISRGIINTPGPPRLCLGLEFGSSPSVEAMDIFRSILPG